MNWMVSFTLPSLCSRERARTLTE